MNHKEAVEMGILQRTPHRITGKLIVTCKCGMTGKAANWGPGPTEWRVHAKSSQHTAWMPTDASEGSAAAHAAAIEVGAIAHHGWRGNSFAVHAPRAIRPDLPGKGARPAVSDLRFPWGLWLWDVHNIVHVSKGQPKTRQEAVPISIVRTSKREPHVVDLVD